MVVFRCNARQFSSIVYFISTNIAVTLQLVSHYVWKFSFKAIKTLILISLIKIMTFLCITEDCCSGCKIEALVLYKIYDIHL